jgi:tetrapyrrole methylase family protein / MazG family protein
MVLFTLFTRRLLEVAVQSQINLPGITLLGLGPGDPAHLTRQAWEWLAQLNELYVRTNQHPTLSGLPKALVVHSFDHLYEKADRFEDVYSRIVDTILDLGQRPQGVTYAVPGHPLVAEATGPEILRRANDANIPLRVIDGLSFLEPVFSALGLDPFPRLALLDALELGRLHTPNFPPDMPVLITQIFNPLSASGVKLALNAVYPDDHMVRLVHAAGTPEQVVEEIPLYEIDRSRRIGLMSALYVPPMGADTSLESFQEVVAHLRAPDGCPWDREQTHQTLRKYLLEETYEAIEALDAEDPLAMREEFGDLLLQIVLHTQIAAEDGEFTMAEVIQQINRKIVRRHPHVFGDVNVTGVDGVLRNWQKLKEAERAANGDDIVKGILDGVPITLPALSQAQEIQSRAARVGFDWAEISPVLAKIYEELDEVKSAQSESDRDKELGDLMFAVVNLVRWYKVDAESALRVANRRFRQRFAYIEKRARDLNRDLNEMTLAEMDQFWDEAKAQNL